jgi:hypothetical protein
MLTEVETYIKAIADADAAHDAGHAEVSNALRQNAITATERHAADAPICENYRVAVNTAWNTLGNSTDDKMIKFMVAHCKDYQGHAVMIMKLLPATADQVREYAENQGWCHIWDQFYAQAVAEGVVPGEPAVSVARKALMEWFRYNYSTDRGNMRTLLAHVDAVLAEAQAAPADAEPADILAAE